MTVYAHLWFVFLPFSSRLFVDVFFFLGMVHPLLQQETERMMRSVIVSHTVFK